MKEAVQLKSTTSIDYAVVECCPKSPFAINTVALDKGWSDLGTWDALLGVLFKDAQGNALVLHSPFPKEKGRDAGDRYINKIAPRHFRPTEVETLLGDPTKANEKLGWVPHI